MSSNLFEHFLQDFNLQSLSGLSKHQLISAPYTHAQGIWAEILTGSGWEDNGCWGYAYPIKDINISRPITQKDLCKGISLSNQENAIFINLPLISEPNSFLACLYDGSNSSSTLCENLDKSILPPGYKARAILSSGMARLNPMQSLNEIKDCELNRLTALKNTLNQFEQWQTLIFRTTFFDLLSHIFGPQVFTDSKNNYYPELRKASQLYLNKLNTLLLDIQAKHSDFRLALISTFSHSNCSTYINLNEVLHHGGFLEYDKTTRKSQDYQRRLQAVQHIHGNSQFSQFTPLVAQGSLLNNEHTKAFSPNAGCIYLNLKKRFSSGIILDEDFQKELNRVAKFLSSYLRNIVNINFSIEKAKAPVHQGPRPDLIISAPGVAFHNQDCSTPYGYPPLGSSVHNNCGFIVNSSNLDSLWQNRELKLKDISDLLCLE